MLKLMDQPAAAAATSASREDGAAAPAAAATPLSAAVLENLASRFRPGGLFLMMLRPDGTVAYHDAAVGLFFQRFVLPMIQYADAADQGLRQKVVSLGAGASVEVWNVLPGVTIAAFPYVEKHAV